MTERLSDVQARIGTVGQLAAVITAMGGIAAARAREARGQLDGIRRYAGMIGNAIGRALDFLPEAQRSRETRGGHAIIALCAEQGFAGAFSARVLDAVGRLAEATPRQRTELLLIGDRGLLVARERGLSVAWSAPMISRAAQVATLANRIVEALYERLDSGIVARVTLVHALPGEAALSRIAETSLVPFDFDRFTVPRSAIEPLLTMEPRALLESLVEEYVFATLCEAVLLSYAAENEARMRAMIAARTNVADTLDELIALSRQLRQEEITNEIIELAGGAAANAGR
jgi:F-type H+-transporting ATPase subunit gamma